METRCSQSWIGGDDVPSPRHPSRPVCVAGVSAGREEAGELVSAAEEDFAWQLRCYGIPYEREYRFCERRYRADFFIEPNLLIEIEGGIWMKGGGGHSHPMHILRDIEKGNAMTMNGYRLLRFTPDKVKSGAAIDAVREVVAHE
jgi:very-short-patch-repair endonuclease